VGRFLILDFGFLILDVVLDIGGVPHALGSVTAVFNGVPSCYFPYRRFRRYAAAPPSIPLVALPGSKIRRTCGSRVDVTRTCERMRAEFSSPQGDSR